MAAIVSTLGGSRIDPRSLNPYRQTRRPRYTAGEVERSWRVHKAAGRFTEQVVMLDQVINDA